ncbi:MAG: CAP domain-containing protein [Patescibacteria group bacterium]|jgi:hypothetical protein
MKVEKSSKKYSTDDCKKPWHHTALHRAKHWFIPHEGNNHQPHALRPKALKAYAYLLLAAKIASAVFLFAAYPNEARYAAYTASTIISLTNESRREAKLPALTSNSKLNLAAQNKAKDIIARNYFAHTTPDGKRFWTWIEATGYDYSVAGENLAIDFTTPESAHSALMASPTHKENIINKRYKEIGVAVVTGKMDGQETTVLVEMFGTQTPKKTQVAKVTTPKPKTPTKVTIKAPTKTTAPPKVKAEQTGTTKAYLGEQNLEKFTLLPEATIDVWAEFKNIGDTTWKAGEISLVTADPIKHDSIFADASWANKYTVESIDKDIKPDEIIRFEWKIKGTKQAVSTTEKFGLMDTEGKLINDIPLVFSINVITPSILAQTKTSPTQTQAAAPTTQENVTQPIAISNEVTEHAPNDIVSKLVGFVDKFYMAFLIFLGIALALNIFVKIRVQHAHVIGQTLMVIAFAAGFLLFKFHFLQKVAPTVRVLGQIIGII